MIDTSSGWLQVTMGCPSKRTKPFVRTYLTDAKLVVNITGRLAIRSGYSDIIVQHSTGTPLPFYRPLRKHPSFSNESHKALGDVDGVNGLSGSTFSMIEAKDIRSAITDVIISLRAFACFCVVYFIGNYSVIGTLACLYLVHYIIQKSILKSTIRRKQQTCRKKLQELSHHLEENGLPKSRQKQILSLTVSELVEKIGNKELTSVDVLKAYQAKALSVHDRINCLVEPVVEAEALARASDQKTDRGLLEGIPVSVKENYYMKGYDSTAGMSSFIDKPAMDDGTVVKVLKKHGAIPFVRTNIPQSMLTIECSNPIYGETVNPHNVLRSPGGSSGGEGALIGAGGSILGFGTDIGGSIRVPSAMCGTCGLKPTSGRIGLAACEELVTGQTLVRPTPGPMGRDVDSVVLAMKALLSPYMFELEPDIPPIPFRDEIYESTTPLTIGYYWTDGYLPSIPAYGRALHEAKEALENRGHRLVPFTPPRVKDAFLDIFVKILFGDSGKNLRDLLSKDETDYTLKLFDFNWRLPYAVQSILGRIASFFANDNFPHRLTESMKGVTSVSEWWELATEMQSYRKEFLSAWRDSKVDAVICPAMPVPAIPSGCVNFIAGVITYPAIYNLVNYPAGVVPVTKVTAKDQVKMKEYPATKMSEKLIKKYFSADTGGLPLCVQCVALPYQEELVLRLMKELETGVRKKQW